MEFLWTTGPLLDEAIATLKAWGITYAAHFAWRKVSRNGKKQWGTGYWGAQLSRDQAQQLTSGEVGYFLQVQLGCSIADAITYALEFLGPSWPSRGAAAPSRPVEVEPNDAELAHFCGPCVHV